MPQLEAPLYSYLTADPGVSALVGTRVFPNIPPEGTILPAVSYRRISDQHLYTYDAFGVGEAWTSARVQFDCWDQTMLGAIQVGEAIMAALSGYSGDMAGQLIGSSFAITEADFYEPQTKLHRRTMDFRIAFEDDLV